MKTFWVNGLNKMGLESGTYVLASEANERIKVLEDALKGMVNSGIEFDDKRLPDITMQVDRRDLDIARAADGGETVSVANRYTGVGYEPPIHTVIDGQELIDEIQRLESRVRELEAELVRMKEEWDIQRSQIEHIRAERDRLKDVFEKEMDHSKFLAELVQYLYGDGWEHLTIHEAKKLRTRHAALVEAAELKRNVIIHDEYGFDGKWVAIPNEDFDKLKAALAEMKG
jgi:hypothetical protein